MSNNLSSLSAAQLQQAASIKAQIESLEAQLSKIIGGSGDTSLPFIKARKGTMSAAGRARVAAAQKKRWAKIHAQQAKGKKVAPAKKKNKLSAAGRAAIVAAQKARWAKIKAAKAGK